MELTKDNYFSKEATQAFMSVSTFKDYVPAFGGCEARAKAKHDGIWEDDDKAVFLQGQYVHAWNENKLPEFIGKNKETLMTQKQTLRSEFQLCETAIEKIKGDELFMKSLAGEKEVILTAELFGVPWKIMIDSYFRYERRFGDLKFLKSFYDKKWNVQSQCYENVFTSYGYLLQMAVYAEIERLSSGRHEDDYFEPFLACVSKEKYHDLAIISFVSDMETVAEFVRGQLSIVEHFLPRVLQVRAGEVKAERCEQCDYCRASKKLTGTVHYTSFNLY